MHEQVISDECDVLFVFGSKCIQFAVIVVMPQSMTDEYLSAVNLFRDTHLYWIFQDNTMHYDITLSNFPKYKNIVQGHAVDEETIKFRLGLKICLYALRMQQCSLLSPSSRIVPVLISLCNAMKVPIDNLSKVLSHNLGLFGPASPMVVIFIHVFSTMLYNAWRLYSLNMVYNYLIESCPSYKRYQHERQRKGRPL